MSLPRTRRSFQRLANCFMNLPRRLAEAVVAPGEREAATAWAYARQKAYRLDKPSDRPGLFSWEERLLASPFFGKRGPILLPGAGGGREAQGLVAMGFSVFAFDPCEELVATGASWFEAMGHGRILVAGYRELVESVRGQDLPLARALRDEPHPWAGVVLGWGSFCHLLEEHQRVAVLRSLRVLAPSAPVMFSYLPGGDKDDERVCFSFHHGFFTRLTPESVAHLAEAAGYRLEHPGVAPYGHGILVPDAKANGAFLSDGIPAFDSESQVPMGPSKRVILEALALGESFVHGMLRAAVVVLEEVALARDLHRSPEPKARRTVDRDRESEFGLSWETFVPLEERLRTLMAGAQVGEVRLASMVVGEAHEGAPRQEALRRWVRWGVGHLAGRQAPTGARHVLGVGNIRAWSKDELVRVTEGQGMRWTLVSEAFPGGPGSERLVPGPKVAKVEFLMRPS